MGAGRIRRGAKRDEYFSCVVRVRTWEMYFSRHATDPKSKWETGEFSDLATLSFAGAVIRPEDGKYRNAKITFSGRADVASRERSSKPVPIGSVTAQGGEIEAYIFIPEERLRMLLTAAQSGRVQVAHFAGPKLRYGKSTILSVSLSTHFDEDEW